MDQERSPLRSGRRLTPELFDFYVARARNERGKAIAAFGGQVGALFAGILSRLVGRRRPAGATHIPKGRTRMWPVAIFPSANGATRRNRSK